MSEEQKIAYLNAMVACANAEIAGMVAENMQRQVLGHSMAYDTDAFMAIIEKYGIHHNAVLTLFRS